MSLIDGSEFANPNVFYQLLSEAHLCLRSSMTSDVNDDKMEALRGSIRRSAVRIGDFFSRYDMTMVVLKLNNTILFK